MNNKDRLSRIGFTLLEVVIALLILVLGLVSIFSLFGIGTQSHRRGVNDVITASYAETVLAEVQGEFMLGHPLLDLEDQTQAGWPSQFKYDVTFQSLKSDVEVKSQDVKMVEETLVTITIKWQSVRGIESEEFQTVLVR